ncbi:hypothetical protein [Arthrobacter sp. zg-Y877]|uniref:hypothetical protein n=1 Tax=Arthrobacter sp. zg-Y877 TaxID=3049074 RepID=UPI0025A473C3|nr:hypothetical protein [Arthrobacter sp. zg-Y877]MDM7990763.1 hypothetical protein [Arthrobacter sp. zg-Y877]
MIRTVASRSTVQSRFRRRRTGVAVSALTVGLAAGLMGGFLTGDTVQGGTVQGSTSAGAPSEGSTAATDSPTERATSGLSAELSASRLFGAEPTVLLKLSNSTPEVVEVAGARLLSEGYAEPQQWVPARPEPVRLRSGATVSLPVPLTGPACPPDGPDLRPAVVSMELSTGVLELAAADPRGDFSALHYQDCLRQGMAAVARFVPQLEVAPNGRTAVVRVLIQPTGTGTGTGSMILHRIDATPLLAPAGHPWPTETTLNSMDGPRELVLGVAPQRCDAHALAEDKLGTYLPLTVTAAGYSGQVRLPPPDEFTAAVYGFVQTACADQ